MAIGAAIGSVVTGALSNNASKKATRASSASAASSLAENRRQFDLQQANQLPFIESGANALGQLNNQLSQGPGRFEGGPQFQNFQGGDRFDFDLQEDPGFKFALAQGEKAANRAQAGTGGFNSGNRLAELTDRAAGISSQFANDAFNRQLGQSNTNFGRDVTEFGLNNKVQSQNFGQNLQTFGVNQDLRQNQINNLQGVAHLGQNAASNLGAAGSNFANSNANISQTNAVNQGNIGMNNAANINNAVQSGISNAFLSSQLNKNGGGGGNQLFGQSNPNQFAF
jgi:hypothetical protein